MRLTEQQMDAVTGAGIHALYIPRNPQNPSPSGDQNNPLTSPGPANTITVVSGSYGIGEQRATAGSTNVSTPGTTQYIEHLNPHNKDSAGGHSTVITK